MVDGGEEDMPRDAKIVKELFKSVNIDDYQPRVVHHFLKLWYRYVVDVLTDAQVYSEHASKSTIDSVDVKLAVQSKVNFGFSKPPLPEVLLELARSRNKVPFPKSIPRPGIRLPPEQDALISPNYQLAIPKRKISQPAEETEEMKTPLTRHKGLLREFLLHLGLNNQLNCSVRITTTSLHHASISFSICSVNE